MVNAFGGENLYFLSQEQKEAAQRKLVELYPGNRLQELNSESSLKTWWTGRQDRIRDKMLDIDRDQMRSAAASYTKWVR